METENLVDEDADQALYLAGYAAGHRARWLERMVCLFIGVCLGWFILWWVR